MNTFIHFEKYLIFMMLLYFVLYVAFVSASPYRPRTVKLNITNTPLDLLQYLQTERFDVWRVFDSHVVIRLHTKIEEDKLHHISTHRGIQYQTLQTPQQAGGQDMYSNLTKIEQRIHALEKSYPHIAKVHSIGPSQQEGNTVYAVKIGANPFNDDTRLPEVIITGVHHAREWISAEVTMGVAEHVCASFSTNKKLRRILSHVELWIIPVMNPDGFAYTFLPGYDSSIDDNKRFWRKNRRGQYGVDPNRNYDNHWGETGASGNQRDETYYGTYPFSEAETINIRNLVGDRRKNISARTEWLSNPIGFLSFHSYGNELLYPWAWTKTHISNNDYIVGMLTTIAGLIKNTTGERYTVKQSSNLYYSSGDACDWFMDAHEFRPAFTMELRPGDNKCCDFELPGDEIAGSVQEGIVAAMYFAEYVGVEGRSVTSWSQHKYNRGGIANEYDEDSNHVVDYLQHEYGSSVTFFCRQYLNAEHLHLPYISGCQC
eukprot:PhF_6_TR13189/c0_g1_i3/m.20825